MIYFKITESWVVIEGDELGIAVDHRVGPLFKGEPDVESERIVPPCAALRRPHDAIAAASDDHEPALAHFAPEIFRRNSFRMILRCPRRAEHHHLLPVCVFRENARCIAQFAQGAIE